MEIGLRTEAYDYSISLQAVKSVVDKYAHNEACDGPRSQIGSSVESLIYGSDNRDFGEFCHVLIVWNLEK
ncbi:MAG: hypothetical protein ACYTHJ_06280 [Planctomycetota bacterium]|jgi:hypothetical protein